MPGGISIVIPTWNGLPLLERFLPSVLRAAASYAARRAEPVEIVIVDDASEDGTATWLLARGFKDQSIHPGDNPTGYPTPNSAQSTEEPRSGAADSQSSLSSGSPSASRPFEGPLNSGIELRLLKNARNLGFGGACNLAFGVARHPLVFLINNDVEVSPDSIDPLAENFADASLFAAHCRVFDARSGDECGTGKLGSFSRGFIRVHRSYVTKMSVSRRDDPSKTLYSMFAGGGSAMFHRDKFLELGGFEALLAPFYWEDVELSYRAWKRGYSVVYEPRSVARHMVSSTIGKLSRRKVRYFDQRNRLIYHWIHIHDGPMVIRHIAWTFFLALTAPLRLKSGFILSLLGALASMPGILRRRREEKKAAKRTDRDIFALFQGLSMRADVLVYDDYDQLLRSRRQTGREPETNLDSAGGES